MKIETEDISNINNSEILLKALQIEKSFPGVNALKKVDFMLRKNEVHCLMGENGAGKSTLIKCLAGVHRIDGGYITLRGKNIYPQSTQHAAQLGISSVYQEVNLCPNLSAAENIFIGREPMRGVFINWNKMEEKAKEILSRFDIHIDVKRSLDSYSIAIQQMIAIARAINVSAQVLILDEPTSSLDKNEVKKLFEIILHLKNEGMGIIFITHFLDQVYEISDRITVLRNGELVGEYKTEDLPKIELVTKMIGKDYDELTSISRTTPQNNNRENNNNNINISSKNNEVIISLNKISARNSIKNISLELRRSEITGFAGLLGSGRTETANIIFGLARNNTGTVNLKGTAVKLASPAEAIKHRIAFCPEDRKRDGIIAELSIRENIILALQARHGIFKYINRKQQNEMADKYIKLLGIATPDAEKKAGELSGGNQQKVILARWLATEPEVMLLDEPTRGIDVGAKAEIMKLTLELCQQGMAIAFISSELDEIVRMSNKVIIMRDRTKTGELSEKDLNQDAILKAIAGGAA